MTNRPELRLSGGIYLPESNCQSQTGTDAGSSDCNMTKCLVVDSIIINIHLFVTQMQSEKKLIKDLLQFNGNFNTVWLHRVFKKIIL